MGNERANVGIVCIGHLAIGEYDQDMTRGTSPLRLISGRGAYSERVEGGDGGGWTQTFVNMCPHLARIPTSMAIRETCREATSIAVHTATMADVT